MDKSVSISNIVYWVLILVVGILIFLTEWPIFIILEPEFLNCVYTQSEEKVTIQGYSGFPGHASSKTFAWRKYFLVSSFRCGEELNSKEIIFSHLEQWLDKEGWSRWDEIGSPCGYLREAEFLDRGEDYIAYIPKGETSLYDTPAVCVAVWPEGNDFRVVFMTIRYSILRSGFGY